MMIVYPATTNRVPFAGGHVLRVFDSRETARVSFRTYEANHLQTETAHNIIINPPPHTGQPDVNLHRQGLHLETRTLKGMHFQLVESQVLSTTQGQPDGGVNLHLPTAGQRRRPRLKQPPQVP
eukprot:256180-Prorocentrum_minimum.AAC.1